MLRWEDPEFKANLVCIVRTCLWSTKEKEEMRIKTNQSLYLDIKVTSYQVAKLTKILWAELRFSMCVWVWWHVAIAAATYMAKGKGHLRSGVLDHPWQHGKTLGSCEEETIGNVLSSSASWNSYYSWPIMNSYFCSPLEFLIQETGAAMRSAALGSITWGKALPEVASM